MTRAPYVCSLALLIACGGADHDASAGGGAGESDAATVQTGGDAAGHETGAGHDAGIATLDAASSSGSGDSATDTGNQTSSDAATTTPGALTLPPANAGLDYQLGGAYTPPSGVGIVSRDRTASPAKGLYNICYVNGFQAQEDEAQMWLSDHPTLVLRDSKGQPVIDKDWNEMLLDVSTADKRTQLATIVGDWIAGCAKSGFAAVEIDNLDSYSRSGGLLSEDDAVAFIALLSTRAHAEGLAIAQKNSSELATRRSELGTDFAVSEECSRYDECDSYTEAYGSAVLMIEYRSADFTKGCAKYPDYSIVLRDVDLTTPGDKAYVFQDC